AEDGIRDDLVTGVQTCALPIWVKGVKMWTGVPPSNLDQAVQADLKKIGIEVELVPGTRKDIGPRVKSGEVALHNHGWSASMWDRSEERRVGKGRSDGSGVEM